MKTFEIIKTYQNYLAVNRRIQKVKEVFNSLSHSAISLTNTVCGDM
jgi:hypothetical protein